MGEKGEGGGLSKGKESGIYPCRAWCVRDRGKKREGGGRKRRGGGSSGRRRIGIALLRGFFHAERMRRGGGERERLVVKKGGEGEMVLLYPLNTPYAVAFETKGEKGRKKKGGDGVSLSRRKGQYGRQSGPRLIALFARCQKSVTRCKGGGRRKGEGGGKSLEKKGKRDAYLFPLPSEGKKGEKGNRMNERRRGKKKIDYLPGSLIVVDDRKEGGEGRGEERGTRRRSSVLRFAYLKCLGVRKEKEMGGGGGKDGEGEGPRAHVMHPVFACCAEGKKERGGGGGACLPGREKREQWELLCPSLTLSSERPQERKKRRGRGGKRGVLALEGGKKAPRYS